MEDCLDGEKQQTKGVQISRQTRSQCMKKSVIRASWDFFSVEKHQIYLTLCVWWPPKACRLMVYSRIYLQDRVVIVAQFLSNDKLWTICPSEGYHWQADKSVQNHRCDSYIDSSLISTSDDSCDSLVPKPVLKSAIARMTKT